jgi:hypothetical protein
MSVRNFLNNNPAVMTIAAIVVLLICLAVLFRTVSGGGGGGPAGDGVYFYNLNTDEVFKQPFDAVPPVTTDSGPATGVRAYVYSCGACKPSEWTVAYVEMYPEAARDVIVNQPDSFAAYDALDSGRMVRTLDSEEWVPAQSQRGLDITDSIIDLCNGGKINACLP